MGQSPEIKTRDGLPSPFGLDLLPQCPKGCSCPCCLSLPPPPRTAKCCPLCGSEPAQRSHGIAKSVRIFHPCRRMVWWAGGAVAGIQQDTTLEVGRWWDGRGGQQLVGVSWKNCGIADCPIALRTSRHPWHQPGSSVLWGEGGEPVCTVLRKCTSHRGEKKDATAVPPAAPGRHGTR